MESVLEDMVATNLSSIFNNTKPGRFLEIRHLNRRGQCDGSLCPAGFPGADSFVFPLNIRVPASVTSRKHRMLTLCIPTEWQDLFCDSVL